VPAFRSGITGVPRLQETASPWDPTVGPCLGPYGGPGGVGVFLCHSGFRRPGGPGAREKKRTMMDHVFLTFFLWTPQLCCAPGRNHRTARLRLSPPTDRSCGRRRRRPTPVQSGGCRAPPPVSRKGWALARDLAALHLDGDEPGPRLRGAGLLRRTRRHQPARLHDCCSQERCSRLPRLKRMHRKDPVRESPPRPCAITPGPSAPKTWAQ